MKRLLEDTPAAIENKLIEGYRNMTPRRKLERVVSLNRALEQLAAARIRTEYGPDISECELRLRLASLRLDREVMITVFRWDPDIKGY